MSLSILDNFNIQMKKQNFERDAFATFADMKAYPETSLPSIFHALCEEDGNMYIFNSANTVDSLTGKWRILKSGGGIGSIDRDTLAVNDDEELYVLTATTDNLGVSKPDNKTIGVNDGVLNVKLSETDKQQLIAKDDGLYYSAPVISDTQLGVAKVDNKTIKTDDAGTISVKLSEDDNNAIAVGTDNSLYMGIASNTELGAVKIDTKNMKIDENGNISPTISERSISNAKQSLSLQSETFTYINNNEGEILSYRVTYVDSDVSIYVNDSLVKTLTSGVYDSTLNYGDKLQLVVIDNAMFRVLTNNIDNLLTRETDGLMINRYDMIATTQQPGLVIPDSDTVTIDDNGRITATVGANSVSNREHNLIELIRTYDRTTSFPTIGSSNVVYRVPNGENFDEYRWENGTYVFTETTTGSNEDGIYIDEDKTVAIATYTEEGKVKPDGNTIILTNPTDIHDGSIEVNTEVIATKDDISDLNNSIDAVDMSSPTLVEYTEDELTTIAWELVTFDEKPEYSEADLDAILDAVFEGYTGGGIGGGGGSSVSMSEITSSQLTSIWNSVFTD